MVVLGFVGREATAQGLPLMTTLRLIPYFLPETLRVTAAMTRFAVLHYGLFTNFRGQRDRGDKAAQGVSPMAA